ncbi:MAG TPA: acyl-CoA dehydrogenase family protein [Pseudoduganella sp.]
MPSYAAPLRDMRYLLEQVFDYESALSGLEGYGDVSLDVVMAVLDSAATFARDVVLPINLPGDDVGCTYDAGAVTTPAGYKEAYRQYCEGGWTALAAEEQYGGQGLPASLGLLVREFMASGSMSFGMYAGLSMGAYRAISAHGSAQLKERYLSRLASGKWTGTMCMTEPQAGSDLSLVRTRATPAGDGSFRVTGTKIFISAGEHDLSENIVHLVLARLPDAPPGTRGISLFLVPKLLPDTGAANGVSCGSIEHKMGIRASATAVLNFDEAQGWLLGKEHGGMQAMFTMMNSSRVGVAVQSLGAAEVSYQNALAYAKDRRQGRAPGLEGKGPDAIIHHPDVRKNLLTMKALVEGARALYIDSAMGLDVRARHPDAAVRDEAEEELALLTPVLKAFISECAMEVTELGIGIFGGHGYVHEHGMEHLYRDARIVPLYEGTNAIQALDLVHRKINQSEGRALQRYLGRIEAEMHAACGEPQLAELTGALSAGMARLRVASSQLRSWGEAGDNARLAAAASDYLRLFGLVATGGMWLRMARVALTANEDAAYLQGKIKTAAYFGSCLLPETAQLALRIGQGGAALGITAEEF